MNTFQAVPSYLQVQVDTIIHYKAIAKKHCLKYQFDDLMERMVGTSSKQCHWEVCSSVEMVDEGEKRDRTNVRCSKARLRVKRSQGDVLMKSMGINDFYFEFDGSFHQNKSSPTMVAVQ